MENHWRGEILENISKVLGLARSMTYAGIKPMVKLVRKVCPSAVKLAQDDMDKIKPNNHRKKGFEKWFIKITPTTMG